MSPASPDNLGGSAGDREAAVQREVTRIALSGARGFALAGSGAIREHGLIERPTEDVDLFTTSQDVAAFGAAVEQVRGRLRRNGFGVGQTRRAAQFARLHVTTNDGLQLDVDLGVDWRQDAPVFLEVGPVLSVTDAVGNKVSALYGRGEARDYLDVDSIRTSGRFSDDELLAAAAERDPGFESGMFADQLAAVSRLQPAQVARYGVTADELDAVKTRCTQWAAGIREQAASGPSDAERAMPEHLRASFPRAVTDAARQPPSSSPEARPRTYPSTPERGVEL